MLKGGCWIRQEPSIDSRRCTVAKPNTPRSGERTPISKKSKEKSKTKPTPAAKPAPVAPVVATAVPRTQPGRAALDPQPSAQLWVAVAALLLVTVVVFSPTFNAQLLSWDDQAYVSYNKLLRDGAGLQAIWNPTSPDLSQYYPLLFTSYWLEYRLWGTNSRGYHTVSLLLHLANIVLVLFLAQRLGASPWVAFGTAAIFALHPTQVASVMWVAERKNTLSGCFYLIAFLLYLRHRRSGSAAAYGACLAAFVAALLSKTQTLTLPVSILAADWLLQRGRRLRTIGVAPVVMKLVPMFALGLVAVLITSYVERREVAVAAFRLPTLAQRPFIVADAPWFYVYKFLLPINLSPIYAKWNVSPAEPVWWLGIIAWPAVLAAAAKWWERIGTLTLWGLVHFFVTLTPVLGVIPFGYQQHTMVADHYLYLAIIGAGLALAASAERIIGTAQQWTPRRSVVTACGVLLVTAYAVQSYRESQHWLDTPTFWRRVIERSPETFAAYYSLAHYYQDRHDWAQTLPLYRKAFEIRGDSPGAFNGYTEALRRTQGDAAALDACNATLQQSPRFIAAYLQRAHIYERLGRRDDALSDLRHVMDIAPKGSEGWTLASRARRRLEAAPSN
jgi:tetratricopeptide (TPR) repeat protein